MTRPRKQRALASISVTFALILGMALPAMTSAALADIATGGGIVPNVSGDPATPKAVSPGNVAGYYLWAKNNDSANLSSFFLTASTTATPVGAYWWRSADPETIFPCDTSNGLKCTFGAFVSQADVVVLAAFRLPTGTSTGQTDCDPAHPVQSSSTMTSWRCVDFQFSSSSGYVPGKNKSRGDAYHVWAVTSTTFNGDQAAEFPFCDVTTDPATCDAGSFTVDTGTKVSKNNIQIGKLTAPQGAFNSAFGTTGIALDDNFTSFSCTADVCTQNAADFLAPWARVDVNSEANVGDWIQVDLTMYGVNANQIDGIAHVWSTGSESITNVCPDADGPAQGPSDTYNGCFWASGLQGNAAAVSVWMKNNGNIRVF